MEVSWRPPHMPPLTGFFSRGRNILFQITGGAFALPVLKQGEYLPHGSTLVSQIAGVFQK